MNVLGEIIEGVRADLAERQAQISLDEIKAKAQAQPSAKDGVRAHSVEGLSQGRWVLLDYVDFVVHVFHPTLRSFYQLERLWGDAPALAVSP